MTSIHSNRLTFSQDQDLHEFRKGRRDDPLEEINRIEQHNEWIAYSYPKGFQLNLSKEARMLYLQSLTVKNILKDTHFTLINGTSSQLLKVIYLIKSLMRNKFPKIDISHYKPLRIPEKPGSIQKYSRDKNIDDHEEEIRRRFISANAEWALDQCGESALCYMGENQTACVSQTYIDKVCKEAIRHFCPRLLSSEVDRFTEELSQLFNEKHDELRRCGILTTISIPKDEIDSIIYRSHPYGKLCECDFYIDSKESYKTDSFIANERMSDRIILERLQQGGDRIFCNYQGSDWYDEDIPGKCSTQYRVYAPQLNPERHLIHVLTALSKETRKELKAGIQQIVTRISHTSNARSIPAYLFKAGVAAIQGLWNAFRRCCSVRSRTD